MTNQEKLNKLLEHITFDDNNNLYFDGKIVCNDLISAGHYGWVNAENEDLVESLNT